MAKNPRLPVLIPITGISRSLINSIDLKKVPSPPMLTIMSIEESKSSDLLNEINSKLLSLLKLLNILFSRKNLECFACFDEKNDSITLLTDSLIS